MSERGHPSDNAANTHVSPRLPLFALPLALLTIALLSGIALASNGGGPYLEVMEPEDSITMGGTSVWVKGQSEVEAVVTVTVENDAGTRSYTDQPRSTGYFEFSVPVIEGLNRITVRSTVHNGEPTILMRNISVDQTPPVIKIIRPETNPSYTNQRRYQITGQVSDPDVAAIPLIVDGHPVTTYTGIFSREVELVEGRNEIDVRASDPHGNEAVVWLTIYADFTPPEVEITAPGEDEHITGYGVVDMKGQVWNATRVVVVHGDVEHGVVPVGGDWNASGTWMYTLELGPDDIDQTIIAKAFDHVGNVAEDRVRIIVDLVPPHLQVEFHHERDGILVYIQGTTDLDVETIEITGILYPVENGEFNIVWCLGEGETVLVLTVSDGFGNKAVETETFSFDNGPPKLKVKDPPDWNGSKVVIRGTTDRNVRTVLIDGVSYPVEEGRFLEEVALEDGQDMVLVVVEDPAGNRRTISVDVSGSAASGWAFTLVLIIVLVAVTMFVTRKYLARRT